MDMETNEETTHQPPEIEKIYETLHRVQSGVITKGKVIAIKSSAIVIDVGYKSEGMIPLSAFTEEELAGMREGDDIYVFVDRINDREGVVTISRERALKIKVWESLGNAYNNNSAVEGKVIGKTKGGLFVDVMGIKGFLPASHAGIKAISDLENFIGKTFPLKILKLIQPRNLFDPADKDSGSLIVSIKAVVEEEAARQREETLKTLREGAILKGVVKNITNYGVFVDLGGIDGLLHISDISWRRVNHPSEFFKVGDEEEFIVLKYSEENKKITLGFKQKRPDPWLTAEERYKPGLKVKGRVVNIVDYGIFMEAEEGLEGLIHLSEIDWASRPKHPSKYASVGSEIEALVLSVNKDERKLSLSLKQLKPKPWEIIGERYKVGQSITGKIKTLTDFGAFVRLPEGVDGLIHISDISWTMHIKHPSEMLKRGQKVDAVILSIETEKERMALGIKQLTPDPWQDEIPAKFKPGEQFKGKVLRTTDFGIFVELPGGAEGLVYSSELDNSNEVKEGDEIWVRIIKINEEERKIGLSMKNLKTVTSNK